MNEQRAAVKHCGDKNEQISQQEQQTNQGANSAIVVALFKKLGRGRAVVTVVNGQDNFGQDDQPYHGCQFPPRQEHHLIPVHAHQLISTQIGQRDRARNDDPAETFTGKKHLFSRGAQPTLCG